ncbi:phosphopyruvate hydratase [Patescibacteria group bacterium]|nr:phosphopyruvate hydratase [Patescibacteria group bacterium]MBU1673434.1 phosphopyruvate hydratase [Patescibacteria group bacterium]MBU1963365.1 phosphopyruvate hydratase [Patescibacteria group bacterium]
MPKIKNIQAREILDSRGLPTIACKVSLSDGSESEAMIPSGASTGVHEALELRDGDKARFIGKGVKKAVNNVNKKIFPKLKGKDAGKPRVIDQIMLDLDGTENKSKLGANAILSVSLATAQAMARSKKIPLYKYIRAAYRLPFKTYEMPYPMMNVINGGQHADNNLDVQEYMIVPQAKKFSERIRQGSEVFHALKDILKQKKLVTAVGDEGGFAPMLKKNEEPLKLLGEASKKAGYNYGRDIKVALDVAASEFFTTETRYKFDGKLILPYDLINIMKQWVQKYPIISIEDGLDEDDWENWRILTDQLGKKVLLVGDDLFVTNPGRLQIGLDKAVGNAILIKLNQIGTLTETIDCIRLAQKNNFKVIVSHRSGETEDTSIADLAVAVNSDYIKTGSLSRSERIAKYNRLLAIAADLKK